MKQNKPVRIFGVMGFPIAHTLSPTMHEAAFKSQGVRAVYLPLLVPPAQVGEAVRAISAMSLDGVNVTIPHKQAVIPFLDELKGQAKLIKAVNTIVVRGKKLIGYNTDVQGLLTSLRRDAGFDPSGKKAVLLGAGGAAQAVAFALVSAGISKLSIANRTFFKAAKLINSLQRLRSKTTILALSLKDRKLAGLVRESDLLVNATSVGMQPGAKSLLKKDWLHQGMTVMDLVYGKDTDLLKAGRSKGAKAIDGLGMLLYQGALSFELWTGEKAPIPAMKKALLAALRKTKR